MKKEDFQDLEVGDIIMHRGNGHTYIITADFGDRKTAVHTADITNSDEWDLAFKASYTKYQEDK